MDFEFDGLRLSDFGCMICSFDSVDAETVSAGSEITFNTTSVYFGKKYILTGTKYEECLSAEFDICKNACNTLSKNFEYFTVDEERDILRWLNRKNFCTFRILSSDYEKIYFEGSFNVQAVRIGDQILGFHLTLTTNRPFGLQEEKQWEFELQDAGTYQLWDDSDEIGYIYADLSITCLKDGTLKIENSLDNHVTQITNCVQGEVITFKHPIVSSSMASHKIMDDFNYNFPKIINTYTDRTNIFTFSLPCKGTISYNPIAKVGI